MTKCTGCGQELLVAPSRCRSCGSSIAPGQPFRHERIRGICEPMHADCDQRQTALI
jgi:predicted Zn-ribbon and HTH transcriptional regulator